MHNAAPHLSRSRRPPWWGWGRQAGGTTSPSSWAAPPVTSPLQTRTHACFLPGRSRWKLAYFIFLQQFLARFTSTIRAGSRVLSNTSLLHCRRGWGHVLSPRCRQISDLDMCIICFPPLKVTALLEDQNYSHPQWCLITVQVVGVLLFG